MKKKSVSDRTFLRVEVTPELKSELELFCLGYGEKISTVCRIALREFMLKHAKKEASSQINKAVLEEVKKVLQDLENS